MHFINYPAAILTSYVNLTNSVSY